MGSFPPPGCPGPARTLAFPRRRLPASRASFCVQRLLPATRTPGHTVATRNLSQYSLKFSKALQPRLHGRRHPTGKQQRRHRSFRHSVFPLHFGFFSEQRHRRDQPPGVPLSAPQRSLPQPGTRAVQSPGPPLPPQRLRPLWPVPSRWYGAAAGLARPGRQGARWPAPPTLSARLDRVRHIGCRSRRGQRFLLCLRCALQVPAA